MHLRAPGVSRRAPISVKVVTGGSKASIYLPRSNHGQVVVTYRPAGENYGKTQVSFRGGMPIVNGARRVAVFKAVREAATSVSVSADGQIVCDIRDSQHRRGRDLAEVTALKGSVTVRYEDENIWGRLFSF